jgi:hypothetical protein
VAELHLYNLRHVQEHAAQLALFLGQRVGSAPGWVGKAQDNDAAEQARRIQTHSLKSTTQR